MSPFIPPAKASGISGEKTLKSLVQPIYRLYASKTRFQ